MRFRGCAWLALSSLLWLSLAAGTRPRYGGVLSVDLPAGWTTLNPTEPAADLTAQSEREAILPLVAETLVRLNSKGDAEAALAVNWQRDADRKRWRFSLRSKVAFHDGEPLTGANVAPVLLAALKKRYVDVSVFAGGQTVAIQSEHSMPDLLTELADLHAAIFRTSDKVPLIGTGPFRVAALEPGRRLELAAFDDYWAGRPFLDSVNIITGQTKTPADIIALPIGPSRRILPERMRIWTSVSHDLIAVVAGNVPVPAVQALELSVDRVPIVNVLTQRRGEAAFGLLPQWLSGYGFLFASNPDVSHAKAVLGQTRITPISLSYSANDSLARLVAERVALNARDAGLTIEPTPNANGSLRLVRIPLKSTDPVAVLAVIAEFLGIPEPTLNASRPETLYEFERSLLESHKIVPIVHLPEIYAVSPRVHDWDAAQKDRGFTLHLENVWVDP